MFEFTPKHEFLVGIDSDGCAFDTMELKHKECFIPNIINSYELQGISKYAREAAEFVNLYSKSRGINRFPGLIETLEWLQKRPEVAARGVEIRIPIGLANWLETETKHANPALETAIKANPNDDLKQALAQSGLMLEARLAADGAPPDEDLKAALLILRQTLETAPAARTDPAAPQPAPPYRGGPVQAQPAMASSLPADAATDAILQRLLQGVEAALARQTLMQLASAPGAAGSPAAQTPQWLFEIPFMVPPGAAIAQLEIGRDEDEHGSAASDEAEPTWRARFSLDLDPMGPVHARISLRGSRVRVTLWAERGATAGQLDAQRDALARALLGDDLVASVAVFPGAPDTPRPAAGKFVDRAL